MNTIPTRTPKEQLATGTDTAFLAEFLEYWAEVFPEKRAHTFIDYSESRKGVEHTVTFGEFEYWTRALAAKIMELTQPGDRVALLVPQGLDYVAAFVGALRTNTINVPLYSPDLPGHAERLQAVVADAAPTLLLTTSDKRELVESFRDGEGGPAAAQILCVDEFRADQDALAESYRWPEDLDFDDVAYLQYTSGSTRTPAGVVLTHRNLAVNVVQLINGHQLPWQGATCVSWLPLFHDMGLLLGAAGPVVGGAENVLLDPVAFILKPLRWLQACSGRQNAITAAPNFAYDYAVKRVKDADKEGLDLSGVVAWANGAEPILPATLDNFVTAFEDIGVRRTTQRPTYGLAEVTVFVSVTPPGENPTVLDIDAALLQQGIVSTEIAAGGRAIPLVSSGKAYGQHVAIVDPDTRENLGEGKVGEIWVNGGNVGRGYWQKPAETEAVFGARLEQPAAGVSHGAGANPGALGNTPGELPVEGWLRTEDLGVLMDGYIFVTGRIKDLIIVDGRNIYPHDVEYTVEESHDGVAQRRLAAFSIPTDAGEAMVVVAERYRHAEDAADQLEEIARAAKQAVSEQHSVALHDFVLIEPDSIARTSSGKIARKATRASYLEGTLPLVKPAGQGVDGDPS